MTYTLTFLLACTLGDIVNTRWGKLFVACAGALLIVGMCGPQG